MNLSIQERSEAKESLRLLAALGIHPSLDELTNDALGEQGTDEPFAYGVQRVENMYVEVFVDDHWSLPEDTTRPGCAFEKVHPVHVISVGIAVRAKRILFADPAKPNRIVFDRFPRPHDGLEQFVELNRVLRAASSIDDLAEARDTAMWKVVESVLQQRSFRPR